MPMKFAPTVAAPNGGVSGGATPLAMVYTLRRENAVVLHAYCGSRSRRNDDVRDAQPRRSLLRLFSCLGEAAGEQGVLHAVPPQLPQLVYGPSEEADECAIPTPETAPLDLPKLGPLCVHEDGLALPPLLLLLLPPHNALPLLLPQRGQPRARSAECLRQALGENRVCATWGELLAGFSGAWASALLRVAVTPPPEILPSSWRGLLAERHVLEYPPGSPCVVVETDVLASRRVDFALVASRERRRECRRCSQLQLKLETIDVASIWMCSWQVLLRHDDALHNCFHAVTRLPGIVTLALDPVAVVVGQAAPPVALFGDGAEAPAPLELQCVVVPRVTRARTQRDAASRVWHFDRRKFVEGLPSIPLMQRPMPCATQLRFPEGRQVRQTLTLRNAAGDEVQKVCEARRRRRRRRRRHHHHHLLLLHRRFHSAERPHGVESRTARCTGFMETPSFTSMAAFSAECLLRQPSWKETKRDGGDDPQLLAPPLLLFQQQNAAFTPLSSSPLSWHPLAVEVDNCGCDCSRNILSSPVEVAPFPRRVFPREVELQSLRILRERWLKRQANAVSTGSDDGEVWYHAALLHDVHTMPLPYRSSSAAVEDAEMHYWYRLAFHREMRRLGLRAAY